MDARCAVRAAVAELEEAGVPEPVVSAELLMSELLGIGRAEILLGRASLSEEQSADYEAYILRRKRREPVQRILGYAYFRYLKLKLNEKSLIPRSDTETVVEAALEKIDRRAGRCRVLDLGTGSGAIAISVAQERRLCEVHATDISRTVLEVAHRNAEISGVEVTFHQSDMFADLEPLAGKVSLLVSNPPYVKSEDLSLLEPEVRDWDPHAALDGGPDGLSFYRRIFREAPPLLEDGADVVLEVGDGQEGAVSELGHEAGFALSGMRRDLAGTPRAVLLRWKG
ncbi:peptide chain release factor N(5)-glutamine methyltransferase [soil metagenome]